MGHREEIGRRLREARQSAGLSLSEVAGAIRVRPVYLTAIEAGEFERLPGLPQTVGFTRAYARHLEVDLDGPLSALGEEVHRHIDRADYSEPEPVWTVSPRRAGYVSAGALLGVLLLGVFLIDFSDDRPSPPIEAGSSTQTASGPVNAERVPLNPAPAYTERLEAPVAARPAMAAPPVSATFYAETKALFERRADVSSSSTTEEASAPQMAPSVERWHFVTGDVYLRAAPANAGAIVAVLNGCEAVALESPDERGQWFRVERGDGTAGWVYRSFISPEKPAHCG
jgi:cytoskeleton protein RodZ